MRSQGSAVTAISVAAVTTGAATSVVDLVTKKDDVQEVDADAAPTITAITAGTAVAAPAAVAAIPARTSIGMTTITMATIAMATAAMATAAFAATPVKQGQDRTGGK